MNRHNCPEAKEWKDAQTFDELCELTARWIEGDLAYHPFKFGGIHPETRPLVNVLTRINRNGFMSEFSQPGVPIKDGGGQRACLVGFTGGDEAYNLAALTLFTDLMVFCYPPGDPPGYRIPITVRRYHPCTWCSGGWIKGEFDPPDELYFSRSALSEFNNSWKIVIVDPKWGRKGYLWKHVSHTIAVGEEAIGGFSPAPYPYL